MSRTIHIAGAGIAGLTLALGLAKLGANVTVLERNDTIQEFGAGLQIGPNARRALNALGLDKAVRAASFEPQGIHIYPFGSKRPLTTLQLGLSARDRYGVPYAVMHRADLVKTLHQECKRFDNINIRFNVETYSATPKDGKLQVKFTQKGKAANTAHPFAFIGADGVASQTRITILGGKEAAYSGYVAWRVLIDADKLTHVISGEHTSLLWAPGFHAVAYPIHHSNKINIALFTQESLSVGFGVRNTPKLPKNVTKDPRFAAILENAGDNWTHWPLASVNTRKWHQGPVGIIGDAAHAMLPFQAQGAAMAIEDAAVLAPLLTSDRSAETALEHLFQNRYARVSRVARLSSTNGRIFHLPPPLSFARNTAIRLQGHQSQLNRLDWLYGFDPTAVEI